MGYFCFIYALTSEIKNKSEKNKGYEKDYRSCHYGTRDCKCS